MDYRIVRKDPFRLAGYTRRAPLIFEGVNPVAAELEGSLTHDDHARLEALSDQEPAGILAVSSGLDDARAEGSEFDYWVAVATSHPAPPDLAVLEVPGRTWAVFTASGPFPTALQRLWVQVGQEWLPANPYRLLPEPEIARADVSADGTHVTADLWLAVEPA